MSLFSTRFVSKLPIGYKTKQENFSVLLFLAEREGFEPPVPLSTSVFKTGAIDHSATSPKVFCVKECGLSVFDVAKVYQKSEPCKRMAEKFENNFIFTPFYLLFLFIGCLIS